MEKINYWVRPSVEHKIVGIEFLIKKVCEYYGITRNQLMERNRQRNRVDARSIIMYILHKRYNKTSTETARIFDLDHCTVLHSCNKVQGFIDIDKEYEKLVNQFL